MRRRWRGVGSGKLGRVAVPVVAIELDDEASARHERIDAELAADQVLPVMGDPDGVKHGVTGAFEVVRPHLSLGHVHGDHPGCLLRIGVATGAGAVGRISLNLAGRRPAKPGAAHLACVGVLVPTLPCVRAFYAAVEPAVFLRRGSEVERLAAGNAGLFLARLPHRGAALARACRLVALAVSGLPCFATDYACILRQAAANAFA
jgi:hypothetical protein